MTEIKKNLREIETSNEHLKSLVAELGRRNREITLLNEMSELLQSCLECKEAHAIITRFAPKLFEAEAGAYFQIDTARNLVEAAATWGEADIGEQSFAPRDCWALRRGRMHFQETASPGMRCRHLAPASEGGHLCIPLLAHGETKGMLLLQLNGGSEPLARESLQQVAAAVSGHIALALANIKLRDTLRHQVLHDPLTGLYNRRYLEEVMLRELPRLARKGAPLGIIILAVDQDRQFHEALGRDAGDTVAQAVSEFLSRQLRPGHIPCRYGRMEFVVLLPEASLETTRTRAAELRSGLEALPVYHEGRNLGKVTVSVGVAGFPEHGATGEELLNAAAGAIYGAKSEGRNQVVVACLLSTSDAAEAK